mmetsp:Transcript_10437/g.18199  ORF Transcript_10437/g.18199 Transcript_10437/m.18199 type:complete len:118 (-) Transcript_10437:379-732(-)|eukprot:CAMPEP_0119108048 /NCGR_PEP_ID=MMETSP1180-20130426/13273_1 /TAXON_ID=3052 ORGANISM="Chlamydomonas cf sp, Strain CCMP681" /NCGR_SAMPLE_ID=MMETSP1180 /ASSEMBLY_ACC=CAM_ASM_000741 /LENGTH=117 /DNA_ID=CAMNT_0007093621 /DNA_START=69 /DNA_END=422 /DNA_ORIENTATION=+
MADEVEESEIEEVQAGDSNGDKSKNEANKALSSMTDSRVPEIEMDSSKVSKAMSDLDAAQKARKAATLIKEKALAAIKIDKVDVEAIAYEMMVDKKLAERRLRECGGDMMAALKSFQ